MRFVILKFARTRADGSAGLIFFGGVSSSGLAAPLCEYNRKRSLDASPGSHMVAQPTA